MWKEKQAHMQQDNNRRKMCWLWFPHLNSTEHSFTHVTRLVCLDSGAKALQFSACSLVHLHSHGDTPLSAVVKTTGDAQTNCPVMVLEVKGVWKEPLRLKPSDSLSGVDVKSQTVFLSVIISVVQLPHSRLTSDARHIDENVQIQNHNPEYIRWNVCD